jgi:ribosomal protein S18 acetylase RimI-like enzyme
VGVVHYRAARIADAEKVAEIYLASRKTFLTYAPLVHSDDDVRKWIRDVLIPTGSVTVALDGGKIIGMMATSVDDRARAWIDQLYIEPSGVGHGTGSALLRRALKVLRRPVRLYTFQENVGARRFYERHGFIPIAFGDGSENEEKCPDVLYELL